MDLQSRKLIRASCLICAVSVLTAFAGCVRIATIGQYVRAAKARAALLRLMRSDPSIFEGADPERFRTVPLRWTEDHIFSWGAFTIDTQKMFYHADVDIGFEVHFYSGAFTVDDKGRWKAGRPEVLRAHKRPEDYDE